MKMVSCHCVYRLRQQNYHCSDHPPKINKKNAKFSFTLSKNSTPCQKIIHHFSLHQMTSTIGRERKRENLWPFAPFKIFSLIIFPLRALCSSARDFQQCDEETLIVDGKNNFAFQKIFATFVAIRIYFDEESIADN